MIDRRSGLPSHEVSDYFDNTSQYILTNGVTNAYFISGMSKIPDSFSSKLSNSLKYNSSDDDTASFEGDVKQGEI